MTFTADISQFVARAKGNIDEAVRMVTIKMAARIVLASPVRIGRFRANWQFGDGALVRDFDMNAADRSGTVTITRLTAAASKTTAGRIVYISNSVPYAIALEHGHSKQAPAGVVRVTAMEFQQYMTEAARALK